MLSIIAELCKCVLTIAWSNIFDLQTQNQDWWEFWILPCDYNSEMHLKLTWCPFRNRPCVYQNVNTLFSWKSEGQEPLKGRQGQMGGLKSLWLREADGLEGGWKALDSPWIRMPWLSESPSLVRTQPTQKSRVRAGCRTEEEPPRMPYMPESPCLGDPAWTGTISRSVWPHHIYLCIYLFLVGG